MSVMREPPGTTKRRVLRVAAAILSLSLLYSCSLIVETKSQQCQEDRDCVAFIGASCDKTKGICVGGGTGGSTSSATASSTSSTSSSSSSSSTTTATSSSSSSGSPGCDVDGGIDGGGCFSCE